MRRFKAFIILIICVLLIATIGKLTFAEDSRSKVNIDELLKTGEMHFNGTEMRSYANVQCVQRGKSFKRGNFKITATAKISGDQITLINYGKGEVGKAENWNYPNPINEKTVEVEGSNILAAILTTANFSHGYGLTEEEKAAGNRENGNKSDAQLAIWYYWNIWSQKLPEVDGVNWKEVFPYFISNEAPINAEDEKRLNTFYKEGRALVEQGVFEAYDENNANMKIENYLYIKNNDGEYEIPENGVYKDGIKRYRKVYSGAREVASGHEYSVTLHLMQFYSYGTAEEDNTEANKKYNTSQNLIVYEPGPAIKKLSLEKIWDDGNNKFATRPDSIKAQITAYKMNDTTNEYENIDVQVYKENADGSLYVDENGDYVLENKGKTYEVELSKNNNWYDEIRVLAKYNDTQLIYYGVKEVEVDGYELNKKETVCYRLYNGTRIDMEKPDFMSDDEIVGTMWNAYIELTNKLKDTVNVKAIKVWDDDEDLDGYRPNSVTVTLKADGQLTDQKVTLDASNDWTYTFEGLDKYKKNENGEWEEISYEVVEDKIVVDNQEVYTVSYDGTVVEKTENEPKTYIWKITNKHEPKYAGYVEITGKVWNDGHATKGSAINGTLGNEDKGVENVKVRLKSADGQLIQSTYSDENGEFTRTDYAITGTDGVYTIRVNYDNSKNVYKLYDDKTTVDDKLKTAYIEFEYDAMKYSTIKTAETGADKSKAIENEKERENFDKTHSTVNTSTSHPDKWSDNTITATTKGVISFETYADKIISTPTTPNQREEIIKYCDGKGNYQRTNAKNAWENIITGQHTCPNCTGKGHTMRTFKVDVDIIRNVNLGLFEREQPEVGIFSDLSKVQVEMNGQKYTYLYGVRGKDFADADIKTQFQNKDEYKYERPVNPADIAYIQEETNKDAMSVFVTYEIELGNTSTTLPITVDKIINVYDIGYELSTITIDGNAIKYSTSNIYGSKEERGFNEITLNNLGLTIQPKTRSEKIQITYEVNKDEIRGLFEGNASLHNSVEIHTYSTTYGENTLYAEQRTGGRTGKAYGGYDYETHPGNAAIRKETVTYTDKDNNQYQAEILKSTENLVEYEAGKFGPERDTDISPSFILCKDEPEPGPGTGGKTLSGTVFEDTDVITTDSERLGDGKYDSATEKTAENVMVELYKIIRDDNGNITGTELAELYKEPTITETGEHKVTKELAKVRSNSEGTYAFEGVVTGEYFIKFTYGNNTEIREDGTKELEFATTMDGGVTTINARNHKSTIITNDLIKKLFELDYESPEFDKKWHIKIEDDCSVAVDNMKDRLQIEDLQNGNFYIGENMTAYSKPFETQVEFEETGEAQVNKEGKLIDKEGNEISNVLSKLDFGIVERPREDIFIEKRVTKLKITLPNGQVLTEGNPSTQTLNYVKNMEYSTDAKNFDRKILVEMDTELIQGSTIEVKYEVIARNNNEKDYDYGSKDDYADVTDVKEVLECDKYITKSPKANYYYYGKSDGLQEMKTTIEIVDYLSNDVIYDEPDEGETIVWEEKTAKELNDNGLINSEHTFKALEEGKNYRIFKLAANEGKITLARGKTSEIFTMSASKRLANKDRNVYDNHVEIIKIDGKTARTIGTTEEGEIIEKSYIPGDYVPTLDAEYFEKQNAQQDDDKVQVILTNSTGITNYVITYLITGLIGLIVLVIGVVMIKKVSTKK